MRPNKLYSEIEKHLRNFFRGHELAEFVWPLGPIQRTLPSLRVLRIAPGPKSALWVYVSLGACEIDCGDASRLEFMIISPEESPRHVELLAMSAYYHSTEQLGLGHTFPIAEPWMEGSQCDHMLVSLPYPFGQELEICEIDSGRIHLYWLLPITLAEREFKVLNGLEAIEELFDDRKLEYWRVDRESVV